MTLKHKVFLPDAQETLLLPLYGRAAETNRRYPILSDPKAVEMVSAIDYDFSRFEGTLSPKVSTLRTLLFDSHVSSFLAAHPEGTVVELGVGLNTRFERLDNGRARWFDLDLPDPIALRRRFFEDRDRRTMIAASVLDEAWLEQVRTAPGPYLFVAEAVLFYLPEADVRRVLALIGRNFPGSTLCFDICGQQTLERQNAHAVLKTMQARLHWACEEPRELERWEPGFRLVKAHSLLELPPELSKRLPLSWRAPLLLARLLMGSKRQFYRLCLLEANSSSR